MEKWILQYSNLVKGDARYVVNVQREGEGKGIEGIHVSLLRGGDGGSQHHPYFAMSHGVLRSPMGQHYKKENRIFGSPTHGPSP